MRLHPACSTYSIRTCLKNKQNRSWRSDSVVKSTSGSCRGPGVSELPALAPGDLSASSGFWGTAHRRCIHRWADTYALTKKEGNQFMNECCLKKWLCWRCWRLMATSRLWRVVVVWTERQTYILDFGPSIVLYHPLCSCPRVPFEYQMKPLDFIADS